MKLRYLVMPAILGTAGYFHLKKEPSPPDVSAQNNPLKIKNRREVTRFYERAIVDLEEAIPLNSIASIRDASATIYDPYRNQTGSSRANIAAENAQQKQVEEYKRRIAVTKAEIGERN